MNNEDNVDDKNYDEHILHIFAFCLTPFILELCVFPDLSRTVILISDRYLRYGWQANEPMCVCSAINHGCHDEKVSLYVVWEGTLPRGFILQ